MALSRDGKVYLLVVAVTVSAASVSAAGRPAFPGWWPVVTFLFFATLLAGVHTRLRIAARGSTSFVMHLAAALLFGGFWAAAIAGASTLLGEMVRSNTPLKATFNVSQRILSVSLAVMAYRAAGGQLPPAYLSVSESLSSDAVQRDLGLFFLFAIVYFLVNTVAVSSAVALSSDRSFERSGILTLEVYWGMTLGQARSHFLSHGCTLGLTIGLASAQLA